MDCRPLGKTGLTVSAIGMGCVTFGREIDRSASFEVMDRAWERGVNLFDTAADYAKGASEIMLGDWMAERGLRDDVILATKVKGMLTREYVLRSAEESLRRLKTDRIDLFQLHSWDDETPLETTLEALNELVTTGKVRAVGCSNWSAKQLEGGLALAGETRTVAMQTVQPCYNLVKREIETDLLPLCVEKNIGVISYGPLAGGFLSGKYRRGGEIPPGSRFHLVPTHRPQYFTDQGYAVLDKLEDVAAATGRSTVQLALGWALSRPHIASVLIGARTAAQVDQAFESRAAGWESDWDRLLTA